MMKQEPLLRKKVRAHIVLFSANTAFKPKVVKLKTRFTRKTKHKGKTYE
jgi:hypothetical protein